ncbi:nucleotide-binding universal stress UspA family protein [Pedobacter sp. UYP24]
MKNTEETQLTKSILVLTDFSKSAKNAAQYATSLAALLRANVILFNSFLIPDSGFDSWPSDNSGSLSKRSKENLLIEKQRLSNIVASGKGTFKPTIDCIIDEGTIAENVCAILTEKKNIFLVIMGGYKTDVRDDTSFGVEITKILNKVACPTMIIPPSEHCLI